MTRPAHPRDPAVAEARSHSLTHPLKGPAWPSGCIRPSASPTETTLAAAPLPISHSWRPTMRLPLVSYLPLASASVELPVDDQSVTSWVPDGRPQRPAKAIVAVQGPPAPARLANSADPGIHLYYCTMLPGSRKEAGECTRRLVEPYGCACAMHGLKEWAMDRRGEMVRSAVRRRPGPTSPARSSRTP